MLLFRNSSAVSLFLCSVRTAQSSQTQSRQGCQIGFFTPNFTNLAFLEVVGVKKIVWLFGFFFFNIWLFLKAVRACSQTGGLAF